MGPDANITNKSLLRSADIILLFFSLSNLHKKKNINHANLKQTCKQTVHTSINLIHAPSPLHLKALYYNDSFKVKVRPWWGGVSQPILCNPKKPHQAKTRPIKTHSTGMQT